MPEASRSDDLDAMRQLAHSPGDSSSLRELRAEGKKTARERISQLLDKGSFVEVDSFVQHRAGDHNMHLHRPLGDGVVAGHGMIDGRSCLLYTSDAADDA